MEIKKVLYTNVHYNWVPVSTAWSVFRLRIEERPPIWTTVANTLNKQYRAADKGWSSKLLVLARCKQLLAVAHHVANNSQRLRTGTDHFVRTVQSKTDMRFGTWNVRKLYRSVSLTAAARELARYRLDLLGLHEVRWDKERTVRAGQYICVRKRKRKSSNGNRILVHHRIVTAVQRVEFVSDRMSYIVLRGHWPNIIVLNVRAPSEEKSADSNYSFMRN
jgi:hypothetical protein